MRNFLGQQLSSRTWLAQTVHSGLSLRAFDVGSLERRSWQGPVCRKFRVRERRFRTQACFRRRCPLAPGIGAPTDCQKALQHSDGNSSRIRGIHPRLRYQAPAVRPDISHTAKS
jgi:hypothetical protein